VIGVLVEKEFAVDASSPRMANARALLAGGICVGLAFGMTGFRFDGGDISEVPRYGRAMFSMIAWLQVAGVLLAGPALTLGAVSGERRRGTLGILTLAGFGPASIVFGKFAARLAATLLVLVTTVPIALFVSAYGGTSPEEVVVVYVTCACAAAWSCALGILLSVLLEEGTAAMVVALTAVALTCGLPLAIARGAGGASATTWFGPLAVLYNVLELGLLADGTGAVRAEWVASAAGLLAQAAGLLAVAALALSRLSLRPLPLEEWFARLVAVIEPLVPRAVPTSAQILVAEVDSGDFNAFAWREAYGRTRLGLRSVAGLSLAATAALVASYLPLSERLNDYGFHMVITLTLVGLVVMIATALASASIASEKEDKSLETLVLLEVVPWRYVQGKFRGLMWICLLLCVPPLVHTTIFWLAGRLSFLVPLSVLVALPMAIACAIAQGLWFSLRAQTVTRAVVAGVVGQILVMGSTSLCCLLFPVNPLYLIASALLLGPLRAANGWVVVPVAVIGLIAYHGNVRYVNWLLWKTTERFNAQVAQHLEGDGR